MSPAFASRFLTTPHYSSLFFLSPSVLLKLFEDEDPPGDLTDVLTLTYTNTHDFLSSVLGIELPGLGTEHLPVALCSGTGSPALGLCSP